MNKMDEQLSPYHMLYTLHRYIGNN